MTLKVKNRTSQFGFGHIIMSEDRHQAVEFLTPMYFEAFWIVSGRPDQVPPFLNVLKPFSSIVWMLIFVSFVVVALTTLVLASVMYNGDKCCLSKGQLQILAILLQQGTSCVLIASNISSIFTP